MFSLKRCLICIGCILATGCSLAFGLTTDFNSYKKNSKTLSVEENKLVLSITTFDGESEKEPLVTILGHSWISIDNQLDHPITIKDYTVQPDEILTMSVWAITNHFGVVFNLEPNFISLRGRYDGRQSLSTNIDESQLSIVDSFIDSNDHWGTTKNCSYWSIHLWNTLVTNENNMKTQTAVYTPTRLQKSFSEYDCVEIDKDFSRAKGVFFYEGGERVDLSLCV